LKPRARRTVRRWRSVVGMVGPDDVKALQARVHDYRAGLQASIDLMAKAGNPLPIDSSKYSIQAWGDEVGRCESFELESTNVVNPFAHLYAGSAYDRGRTLIAELDEWRDELERRKAPNVPAPVPVPHSDLGLAGALGLSGLAILALVALYAMKK
jgi:hypothetical protein